MNRDIDVYIFHGINSVVMGLFREDKLLRYKQVPKQELGEKWVESFTDILGKEFLSLKNIQSIYLNNSFSTWNATRLITFFVKILTTFENISFYLREESQDKIDIDSSLKSFGRVRSNFRLVDVPNEIAPLYRKCSGINI